MPVVLLHEDYDRWLSAPIVEGVKQLPPHVVKTLAAAKLPRDRDAANAALAAGIDEQLQLSGWNISAPPPPSLDRGR